MSFLLFSPATLSQASSSSTVNVTIGTTAQITLSPLILNFTGLAPGTASSTQLLDIVNSGSLTVTNIYASVSTVQDEPRRPYQSSNSLNYSSGDVLVYRNSSDTNFYFAGRLEWNATSDPGSNSPSGFTSLVSKGFFINTSYEYFWALGNGTDGNGHVAFCNETGAQFGISTVADNGTVTTRSPTATALSTGDINWGYFPQTSGPLSGSCVAASSDCTKIYIYHFDESVGLDSCTNSAYIQAQGISPGNTHVLTLAAYVPYGIPAGSLNTTTFTVTAT